MPARSLPLGVFLAAALYAAPVAAAQAVPTCFGQPATIVGTNANDTIDGTEGPDVIVGGEGADTIDGHGGDDLICGDIEGEGPVGNETDGLQGGDGDDKISGGPDADTLDGGNGDDLLFQRGGFEWFGGNLIGGAGDDRLIGSQVTDHMVPGEGRDLVRGRRGNDVVRYDGAWPPAPTGGMYVDLALGEARGQGVDRLVGVESVFGTGFADVLLGDDKTNLLGGLGGADLIRGRGGNDSLGGGDGWDKLHGGPGRDEIGGGGGSDVAYGNRGDDKFFMVEAYSGEEQRRDVLWGGPGSDFAERDFLDVLHSIEQAPPPG